MWKMLGWATVLTGIWWVASSLGCAALALMP